MTVPLGRIVIYTKKIDQMAEFYAKHFGFSVSRTEGDRIIELTPQAAGIAILLHPASAKQREGQVLIKLVFDVTDVEAFCEASSDNGLRFGKVHKAGGYLYSNAKDPSGNSIQVSSRVFAQR
ncbi:MAG: VOC family protein [Hyphomicrobiales bacterium]